LLTVEGRSTRARQIERRDAFVDGNNDAAGAVTRTKFWPREDWKSQLRFRPRWRLPLFEEAYWRACEGESNARWTPTFEEVRQSLLQRDPERQARKMRAGYVLGS
jgi:hypothetical protein